MGGGGLRTASGLTPLGCVSEPPDIVLGTPLEWEHEAPELISVGRTLASGLTPLGRVLEPPDSVLGTPLGWEHEAPALHIWDPVCPHIVNLYY